MSHDLFTFFFFYWNAAWTKALKWLYWIWSKDWLFHEFSLIYNFLLPYNWKFIMISRSQMYQYPVVIQYKLSWIWTGFFFPFFDSKLQSNRKLSITIHINTKQLKSTKCFKYIKCSIRNSLVVESVSKNWQRGSMQWPFNTHMKLLTHVCS